MNYFNSKLEFVRWVIKRLELAGFKPQMDDLSMSENRYTIYLGCESGIFFTFTNKKSIASMQFTPYRIQNVDKVGLLYETLSDIKAVIETEDSLFKWYGINEDPAFDNCLTELVKAGYKNARLRVRVRDDLEDEIVVPIVDTFAFRAFIHIPRSAYRDSFNHNPASKIYAKIGSQTVLKNSEEAISLAGGLKHLAENFDNITNLLNKDV